MNGTARGCPGSVPRRRVLRMAFDVRAVPLRRHAPFAWQHRLLDHLIETCCWPGLISAPTGSGKSSVVEVHLFACALYASGRIQRMPRRLALVVNRRALVDSQAQRSESIQQGLHIAPPESLPGRVGAALRTLRSQRDPRGESYPFDIVDMRGGIPPPPRLGQRPGRVPDHHRDAGYVGKPRAFPRLRHISGSSAPSGRLADVRRGVGSR